VTPTLKRLSICAALASGLLIAGCGGDTPAPASEPVGVETPSEHSRIDPTSEDAPVEPGEYGEGFDADAARADAIALLGLTEDEVGERSDVRTGRNGDEHFMLTEDYVLGRKTLTYEADAQGVHRVTEVVIEMPGSAQTVIAER
jgi:hypothetical protein